MIFLLLSRLDTLALLLSRHWGDFWIYSNFHECSQLQVRLAIGKLCTLPLKDVRLIRDKATNTSRGFCFVELNSVDVSFRQYLHMYMCSHTIIM